MEKINKPLPSGAYPNQHDTRDLYDINLQYNNNYYQQQQQQHHPQGEKNITKYLRILFKSRTSNDDNRMKNYCGIVANKTSKLTHQFGNFINTHNFLKRRNEQRQDVELRRLTKNFDKYNNYKFSNIDYNFGLNYNYYQSKPELIELYSNLNTKKFYDLNYSQFDRKKYSDFYDCDNLNNYKFNLHKSIDDLSDIDIDRILERDTTFHLPIRTFTSHETIYERYKRFRQDFGDDRDDNYIRLYQSLSKINEILPNQKYAPGKVHYEREYRIYGRDTVALIYYKTCYL